MKSAYSYRELIIWQKSKELVLSSYRLSKLFPVDEKFALTSQVRRAASSVPANIAEGFGRLAPKDKEHLYVMARGSLYELDTHLQIAYELAYITKDQHEEFLGEFEEVAKILSAFIKAHQIKTSNI